MKIKKYINSGRNNIALIIVPHFPNLLYDTFIDVNPMLKPMGIIQNVVNKSVLFKLLYSTILRK
ncbi:hypothetical protein [Clostridium sp. Marseille-Q2269]|uniref:hypothetical protein n=1 Tax=Clostridium sp. Marseille-Q2269 TaxID=2942205 RepID=UPI0020743124|nr:hypothetical protein [Clostridium sp. Marseille-Q2269]